MKKLVLTIIAVLSLSTSVMASTFYVATNGSASTTCQAAQSVNGAFDSLYDLGNAQCVHPGDTIYVRAGTYTDPHAIYFGFDPYPQPPNTIPFPGGPDPQHPTRLMGYPGDARPVFASPDNPMITAWNVSNVLIDGINFDGSNEPKNAVFSEAFSSVQNFTLSNSDIGWCPTNCLLLDSAVGQDLAHFLGIHLKLHDAGNNWDVGSPGPHVIYGHGNMISGHSVDVVWDDIEVFHNLSSGFSDAVQAPYEYSCGPNCHSADWTFRNSYFHDNTWAMTISGDSDVSQPSTKVYNNVFANNGLSPVDGSSSQSPGVAITLGYNNTANFQIFNNTFYNNYDRGDLWTGYQGCQAVCAYAIGYPGYGSPINIDVQNNIFFHNGSSDTVDPMLTSTQGYNASHNLAGIDPLFVNAAGNDFHLRAGSPAIGAGATLAIVTTDKDGNPRVAPYSDGAYNGTGGPPPTPPTITTTSIPPGVVGVSYSTTLAASGGKLPYVWTITGLPSGLSANGAVIAGNPTSNGTFSVVANVTDANGASASATFSLVINSIIPPPPTGIQCILTIPDVSKPGVVTTTCKNQ